MSTILIVDDEPLVREFFRTILERDGHTLLTAPNGHEALACLRDRIPDLVLLDLDMPVMDGMTFLRLIRRNPQFKDLPVVIVSGKDSKEQIIAAAGLGVREYLLKASFSLRELRARLAKHLNPPAAPAEPVPMMGEVG